MTVNNKYYEFLIYIRIREERARRGDNLMKSISALFVIVSMLCVSIAGAAFSINQTNNGNVINNKYPINLPTESPEVNTNLLKSVNQNI